MKSKRPVGALTVVGATITRQKPNVAVYYAVEFVDEEGTRWRSEDAEFIYDLKPIEAHAPAEEPKS